MADKTWNSKLYALIIVVAVLALFGAGYYLGYFGRPPALPPQANQTPGSQLFISALGAETALNQAHFSYVDVENGAETRYEIKSNGTDGWVLEQGDYGSLEGYFGANNTTDFICLTYLNKTKCAKTGSSQGALEVAGRLKTRLPNQKIALANKQLVERLIGADAMKFSNTSQNETVGSFETTKLTYTLDYRNLTVRELLSIGISANDPTIYSITDWVVFNWVDHKSGILVKSNTSYLRQGQKITFSREYSTLETGPLLMPEKPAVIVGTDSFVAFYQGAEEDYSAKRSCLAQPEPDRSGCLKSMAYEKGEISACGLINNADERGICVLVVAQNTMDAMLCPLAGAIADDCYIAVVSATGDDSLCKNLQNSSLLQQCYAAKIAGERQAAQRKAEAAMILAGRNCETDAMCHIGGNASQYCAPANNTGPFANESSPLFACLKGVPCGCVDGYCQFKKNESQNYSACTKNVEDAQIEEFVKSLAREAEKRRNSTNASQG